jgi:hypothetical protein
MASVSRRWASGEASHLARVSSKQVLLIRKFYTNGNVTQSALDERFANVGRIATTISTLKGRHTSRFRPRPLTCLKTFPASKAGYSLPQRGDHDLHPGRRYRAHYPHRDHRRRTCDRVLRAQLRGDSGAICWIRTLSRRGHCHLQCHPNTTYSTPYGINPQGATTGAYFYDGNTQVGGFVRDPDGNTTTFQYEEGIVPTSINANGTTAGWYDPTSGSVQGFVRSAEGRSRPSSCRARSGIPLTPPPASTGRVK